MKIIISNTKKEPIYEQIVSQIKSALLTDKLEVGEMLPSIRAMSADLEISVITVKRAYDILEKEGMISTVPGKGSYVLGQNIELAREFKLGEIQKQLLKVIDESKQYGISKESLFEIIDLLY